MKKMISGLVINIFILAFLNGEALSWNEEVTHPDLSKYAARNSVLSISNGAYLKNIGFKEGIGEYLKWGADEKTVEAWLQEGAKLEDAGSNWDVVMSRARFNNHFHNPLKPWENAGLADLQSGQSALIWAQNSTKQQNSVGEDWSWKKARDSFYLALTSRTDTERQANFAQTFRGLGHQMHLLQDMAVPAHVRNDAHPEYSLLEFNRFSGDYYFEIWAKKYDWRINTFASTPIFPSVDLNVSRNGMAPIFQFIDSEQYNTNAVPSTSLNWGLAEYTNANFVSDDTIFTENFGTSAKHYFPYPRYTSQNQCYEQYEEPYGFEQKLRKYWKKKCLGEPVNHFVTVGPLFNYLPTWNLQRLTLKLDESTHSDYAFKLIPRAVGYSAGLLNYFFRGEINLEPDETAPERHVIVNESDGDMNGTFELWYDNTSEEREKAWSGTYFIGKKSSGNNKSASFTFNAPSDAKEPGKYMLVFQGKMGAEEDAVAGKGINIEKEYIFLINNTATTAFEIRESNKQYQLIPATKNINVTRFSMPSTLLTVQSHPDKKEHKAALPRTSFNQDGTIKHTTYNPNIEKYGGQYEHRWWEWLVWYTWTYPQVVRGFPNAYIPQGFEDVSPYVWDLGLTSEDSLYKTDGYYIHGRRPFSIVDGALEAKNIHIRLNGTSIYYKDRTGNWIKSIDLPTKGGEISYQNSNIVITRIPDSGSWPSTWSSTISYSSKSNTSPTYFSYVAILDKQKSISGVQSKSV